MVGSKRQDGVRRASDSTIEIDFYYRGVRCRERLKLPPTARNLQFAQNLRGQVLIEIEKGLFDYATHFPTSARAKLLSTKPDGLITVALGLDDWYSEKQRELEHSTLIGYRRIIDNVIVPSIGDVMLRDFNRSTAKKLINDLGDAVTAKRINNVLGPLRGMLGEALADGLIESNPCDGLKVKRKRLFSAMDDDDDNVDPFTPAEVTAILGACIDEQFRNYCQFNFATGLRISEMIGLWWPRCDLINGRTRITQAFTMGAMKATKTEAGLRDVDLLPQALMALQAQKKHTLLSGEAVFHNPGSGKAWEDDQQIRKLYWRRALKKAGVRYRAPKQMRHTFASQAISAGENVMWVARQLGHKSWTVTAKHYARWIPSAAADAGSKVSKLWSGFGQPMG